MSYFRSLASLWVCRQHNCKHFSIASGTCLREHRQTCSHILMWNYFALTVWCQKKTFWGEEFCIILQSVKEGKKLHVIQVDGSLLDVMDLQHGKKIRWKEDLHDVHTISDYAVCFCCVWADSIACRFADLPIPGSKCSHLIPCCRLSTSDYFFSIESWRGPNLKKKTLFPFCFRANLTISQFAFISSFERAQRKKKTVCARFMALFDKSMSVWV